MARKEPVMMDIFLDEDYLEHYGTPRHSGRYPWGSGENPYQRNCSFLGHVHKLTKQGLTHKQIAEGMGMSINQLRKRISIATEEKRAYEYTEARRLLDKGMSVNAAAKRMDIPEPTLRGILKKGEAVVNTESKQNAELLKKEFEEKRFLDIGAGTEYRLGISRDKFETAIARLESEGYVVHKVKQRQAGTGEKTTMKVLCPPGTEWSEVNKNKSEISLIDDLYSEDRGTTLRKIEPPQSIDSSRVAINYAETGGEDKDGLIEIRRGCPDLDLGDAHYAQVRIAVDGTHYIKGMAIYSDNVPPGKDILFNTNKHEGTPMMLPDKDAKQVLKPMDIKNPENPFGATIRLDDQLIKVQRHYKDENGNEKLSALNVVNEEGNWDKWHKSLASQFLGKQAPALAKQQLDISKKVSEAELKDILSLTNPTVRAMELEEFAGKCDSAATHMAAAALPRQSTKAILPFPEVKENEIFAPDYKDGERVILVRYPHAGIFEIPTLTVNNRTKSVRSILSGAQDAVGINKKTADKLSGADFDGDNVLVIPIDNLRDVRTMPPLKGLVGFDPKAEYPGYEGMHKMTKMERNIEMGKVSNLITDMTIRGAKKEELERAVKHSMVVVDAYKHELNYRQSYLDNRIQDLQDRYQKREEGINGSASTLLSRATADVRIPERKEKRYSKMTPEEQARYKAGEMVYEDTNRIYSKSSFPKKLMTEQERKDWATGDTAKRELIKRAMKADGRASWDDSDATQTVSRMSMYDNAYDLVSTRNKKTTTQIERIYADYANSMKDLAKQARAAARAVIDIPRNPTAREMYKKERDSLKAKYIEAAKNQPLERRAQTLAGEAIRQILWDNPQLTPDDISKVQGQQLNLARSRIGAKKKLIDISPREWEAINAGAISKTELRKILNNADKKKVRQLALPKTKTGISSAKTVQAKALLDRGYTRAEVADLLDISIGQLNYAVEGKKES